MEKILLKYMFDYIKYHDFFLNTNLAFSQGILLLGNCWKFMIILCQSLTKVKTLYILWYFRGIDRVCIRVWYLNFKIWVLVQRSWGGFKLMIILPIDLKGFSYAGGTTRIGAWFFFVFCYILLILVMTYQIT